MGFVFFFLVSWLVLVWFAVMKKSYSFVENTFAYLLILVISVNWSWIVYEELKLVELSRQPLEYWAFLIHRSVGIPLIVVIAANYIRTASSFGAAALRTALSVAVLFGLTLMGPVFGITKYARWNIAYDALYFLSLHLVAYYALEYFHLWHRREAKGE